MRNLALASKERAGRFGSVRLFGPLLLSSLLSLNCVHVDIQRISRARFTSGPEAWAPMYTGNPRMGTEVAIIRVRAQVINTRTRRLNHLLRTASLLGCEAVGHITHAAGYTEGTCLIDDQLHSHICFNLGEPNGLCIHWLPSWKTSWNQ